MQELWRRIEAELERMLPSGGRSRFRPGATERRLASFERRAGFRLPSDVRESWSIHDGSVGQGSAGWCFPWYDWFFPLLSLAEISRNHDQMRKAYRGMEDAPALKSCIGPAVSRRWQRGWIPFLEDGTGDTLCLDLVPAAGGVVGQVLDLHHISGPLEVLFPSFRVYLERYASDLEYGLIAFDAATKNAWYRVPGYQLEPQP